VNPEGWIKRVPLSPISKGSPTNGKRGFRLTPRSSTVISGRDRPVYKGDVNKLKYEFIVHPGADPAQIRLAYRGTERVEVTEEGRLRVTTPPGSSRTTSLWPTRKSRGNGRASPWPMLWINRQREKGPSFSPAMRAMPR